MWQRGENQPCDCVGVLVGFQVVWLINAMKTETLMRHFLAVFRIISYQGQTRSSNRRVHVVLRRLLCSYLCPGYRRSSQRQYHDQGNWAGNYASLMLLPSKSTSEVEQSLCKHKWLCFRTFFNDLCQADLSKNETNKVPILIFNVKLLNSLCLVA